MSTVTVSADASAVELIDEWREEFDGLIQALCINRRSAMVVCPQVDHLDGVSRAISNRLRRVPGMRLEVVRPLGSESLMERFNEMVEALPLEVARREGVHDQPLTLWVMNLSRRLELPEVQLLLNLVQSFPGTGVRLLLLCSRDAASAQAIAVASRWGTRLHRWFLQPTREAAIEPPAHAVASDSKASVSPRETDKTLWHPIVCAAARLRSRGTAALHSWRAAMSPLIRRIRTDQLSAWPAIRVRAPGSRWVWGFGGLMASFCAASAAWWHTRFDLANGVNTPQRRPVPEIVELIEDARPQAVRQEQRS
jgi:hypothetical protein